MFKVLAGCTEVIEKTCLIIYMSGCVSIGTVGIRVRLRFGDQD